MRWLARLVGNFTGKLQFGLVVAGVLALPAARALPQGLIEYEFAGVVADNTGNLGIFGPLGTVQINDAFTGRFSYLAGPGNPDQMPADPKLGAYNVLDFIIDQSAVSITPLAAVVRHEPGLPTLPPLPADLGTDSISIAGTFLSGGLTRVVSLRLAAPYEAVFTDDSLPASLALADFPDEQSVISIRVLGLPPDGMSQIDAGQLTSLTLVPEPGTFALLLLPAIGIAMTLRRR